MLSRRAFLVGFALIASHCAFLPGVAFASEDIISQVILDISSQNNAVIHQTQEEESEGSQEADIEGEAETIVTTEQIVESELDITVEQTCIDDWFCLQHADPSVTIEAIQDVTATSENIVDVIQESIDASQAAEVDVGAHTVVTAEQIVSPDIAIEVAQNCSVDVGVCVQSAIPAVITLATQIIEANALNDIDIEQQTESGALQVATVDATAQTEIYAMQIVTTDAVIELVQRCRVDVGLCIQDAAPLIQTLAQQVVDAHATNNVDILQDGGDEQVASIEDDASVTGTLTQSVTTTSSVEVSQECDVGKGVCIQTLDGEHVTWVFTDGETTEYGEYTGDLDEHALDGGPTRENVTAVAMGICPQGEGLCPRAQQLVFWIFGPEPVAPPPPALIQSIQDRINGQTKRRGHQTNVMKSIIAFTAKRNGFDGTIPPPVAGGNDMAQSEKTLAIVCAAQEAMPALSVEGMWEWTAREIATTTGASVDKISALLRARSTCGNVA